MRAPEARQCGGSLKFSAFSVPFYAMLGRGAQKTFKTVTTVTFFTCTFFTCTSAPGGVAAPKIQPRPGGGGCAKNPSDRKFTLPSRFAFHLPSTILQKKTDSIFSTSICPASQKNGTRRLSAKGAKGQQPRPPAILRATRELQRG